MGLHPLPLQYNPPLLPYPLYIGEGGVLFYTLNLDILLEITAMAGSGVNLILFRTATCPFCEPTELLLNRVAEEFGLSFCVYDDVDGEAFEKWGIRAVPTIVTASGIYEGMQDLKTLREIALAALCGEVPVCVEQAGRTLENPCIPHREFVGEDLTTP